MSETPVQVSGPAMASAPIIGFVGEVSVSYVAYLGGDMVFTKGTGVNHTAWEAAGEDYEAVLPAESVQDNRLVRLFAKRFTVQERLGQQIADTFDTMLLPHGVAVYLDAHHLCMEMRGVRETAPLMRTTFWRGEYERNASLRVEFLLACGADL